MRNSQYGDAMAENQAAIAITTGKSIGNAGDGRVAFIARDDVAAVAAALVSGVGERNRAYDVTGPESVSWNDVAALVAELSGAKVEVVDLTDEQMYAMWDSLGVPREATGDFSRSPVPWCSDGMVSLGREALKLEWEFNKQAGFTEKDDELPDFFYNEPLAPSNKAARHHSAEVNKSMRELIG